MNEKEIAWDKAPDGSVRVNDYNLGEIKQLLNSVGPGFCLAKWNQVTLHLGRGHTHSCHHPASHKIPLAELVKNPSALHNTEFKKQQRKTMLEGKRPEECDYCWRNEDENNWSDRQYKSMEYWALDDYDYISKKLNGNEDVYPKYMEVSFGNTCNQKCTYCGPESSSQWVSEIKKNGPIKVLAGTNNEQWTHGWQDDLDSFNYKNNEHNPYIDAFWEWWPEAYKHLKVFRITGGEPLLSKETFKIIDWMTEHRNPDLEFHINSNLNVPDETWNKFIKKIEVLKDSPNINNFSLYTSVEGWGERAEYARTGLDFKKFKQRYEQVVGMGNVRCVIMATYNIFSVTSFKSLLEWQLGLRKKYNCNPSVRNVENAGWHTRTGKSNLELYEVNSNHKSVVGIDIPYLRHPIMLDAHICTHDLVEKYMIPNLNFLASNMSELRWWNHQGFETYEFEKLRRIILHRLFYNQPKDNPLDDRKDLMVLRAKFYDFINQIDTRNNTSFINTFPEMKHFYDMCEKAYSSERKTI